MALSGLGDTRYVVGRMRTVGEQFRAWVDLCQLHGLRRVEAANRHMIGWTRLHLLEFFEAETDGLAAIKPTTDVGHPRAQLLGLQQRGMALATSGLDGRWIDLAISPRFYRIGNNLTYDRLRRVQLSHSSLNALCLTAEIGQRPPCTLDVVGMTASTAGYTADGINPPITGVQA